MENTQTPQQIVNDFLDCLFSQYHPVIRTFIEDMGRFGETKASQLLLNNVLALDTEEAQKALADAQKFRDTNTMNSCINQFKDKVTLLSSEEALKTKEILEKSPMAKFVNNLLS
ncbi:MAG: hypothetical protein MUC49_04180 [Raineya sp.]|jgi:hypothetical protein|nr:hypothetical protein [Raineya sp.]